MRYALCGFGKMGQAINAVATARGHERVAVISPGRHSAKDLAKAQVAFEFTEPASAQDNVVRLLSSGISVVCGTTGWDPSTARVRRALKKSHAGLVFAPNFSVGMGLFFRIAAGAARTLAASGSYDPFVVEMHHRAKADSPSGTARKLAAIVQRESPRVRSIHDGALKGRLPAGAMHVVGIRAGHEEGTHTVGFDGEHDTIRLTHRARGRSGLALGAVIAAEWIQRRSGSHSFEEVLDDLLATGTVTPAGGKKK